MTHFLNPMPHKRSIFLLVTCANLSAGRPCDE